VRTVILFSAVCLAAAATAVAQKPAKGIRFSDVAGTWSEQTTIGPKDTVITGEMMATADGKGWMTKLAGRDPIPTRIVAIGGDSIVTESGPFESVLRPGQMVRTRTTAHYKGDTMTGILEAHYANGDVLKGKVTATRKQK
jgi:hypothetical protein